MFNFVLGKALRWTLMSLLLQGLYKAIVECGIDFNMPSPKTFNHDNGRDQKMRSNKLDV